MTVKIKCYETMGVPNSVATCDKCGDTKSYYPLQAAREGFVTMKGYGNDLKAAETWAKNHECKKTSSSSAPIRKLA